MFTFININSTSGCLPSWRREMRRLQDEADARFPPHSVLNGRYLLSKLLGKGGFSDVYLVRRPGSRMQRGHTDASLPVSISSTRCLHLGSCKTGGTCPSSAALFIWRCCCQLHGCRAGKLVGCQESCFVRPRPPAAASQSLLIVAPLSRQAVDVAEWREVALKVHQLNNSWRTDRKEVYVRHAVSPCMWSCAGRKQGSKMCVRGSLSAGPNACHDGQ